MVLEIHTTCLNRPQSAAVPRVVLKGCVWLFHRRRIGPAQSGQTAVSNAEALLFCETETEYVCVVKVTSLLHSAL